MSVTSTDCSLSVVKLESCSLDCFCACSFVLLCCVCFGIAPVCVFVLSTMILEERQSALLSFSICVFACFVVDVCTGVVLGV